MLNHGEGVGSYRLRHHDCAATDTVAMAVVDTPLWTTRFGTLGAVVLTPWGQLN